MGAGVTVHVLSVGTTEPRNVAGVGRDLIVGTELGCSVATAVAAVSAQDDAGVHALHVVPPEIFREEIGRFEPRVVRAGALGSAENVAVFAEWLRRRSIPGVVDPVMRASAGGALTSESAIDAIVERVAVLPTVVLTPNLPEAAVLLGRRQIDDAATAAAELQALGARAVLLKGGHASGDPSDVLATAHGVEVFTAPRIDATLRGSGCALAMAVACGLARNLTLRDAVVMAREYVRAKMHAAVQRNGADQ